MSAVSNSVMPRSIALWITLREVSRSVRWPKLLQPRPTAETRRPEPPRLRICMIDPVGMVGRKRGGVDSVARAPDGRKVPWHCGAHGRSEATAQKKRPRSDAATDGDRFGAR